MIGKPKSSAGERIVPLFVTNTLEEWKLASPSSELVFTDVKGVEFHQYIVNRGLIPTRSRPDSWLAERPKCTGLHALRHFYASWCINRPQDGGPRSTAQGATRAMGPFLDHHDV